MLKNSLVIHDKFYMSTNKGSVSLESSFSALGVHGSKYIYQLCALSGLTGRNMGAADVHSHFSSYTPLAFRRIVSRSATDWKVSLEASVVKLEILKDLKFYKAVRLAAGLPLRGQRTHTNAQTARKLNFAR